MLGRFVLPFSHKAGGDLKFCDSRVNAVRDCKKRDWKSDLAVARLIKGYYFECCSSLNN